MSRSARRCASGGNPKLEAAIRVRPQVMDLLKQDAAAHSAFGETMVRMRELAKLAE